MSLLCIQRTLTQGRLTGLVSGLGIAAADALYGAVAGFGLTAISTLLLEQQVWLRLVGGLFLLWLGARTLVSPPAARAAAATATGLASAFGSMLALTATNPTTILSFAAIFAGFGVAGSGGDVGAASGLVLGVFIGSALWWLVLTTSVGWASGAITPRVLGWVNRGAGLIFLAVGLVALLSLRF
jgi:threonine/homoserine/homoserine lactone efflux protein